jgi:hypothetical protein
MITLLNLDLGVTETRLTKTMAHENNPLPSLILDRRLGSQYDNIRLANSITPAWEK